MFEFSNDVLVGIYIGLAVGIFVMFFTYQVFIPWNEKRNSLKHAKNIFVINHLRKFEVEDAGNLDKDGEPVCLLERFKNASMKVMEELTNRK